MEGTKMSIEDANLVMETYNWETVNKYLNLGWTLLGSAPGKWQDTQEAYMLYSLCWKGDLPPKRPE
jgi:hypothetical protein